MDDFLNLVRGVASQLDQSSARPRCATVTSVDPTSYAVRVSIQPEGVVSGWLPVLTQWVGAGWGMACPPSPGDQVLVLWQEDDAEHGLVVGRLWSSQVAPPAAVAGELWLVHQSGAALIMHNDGTIESRAATWKHTGDLVVSGNVSDGSGSLARLRGHYDQHVHPPASTPPSPQD